MFDKAIELIVQADENNLDSMEIIANAFPQPCQGTAQPASGPSEVSVE